MRDLNFQDSGCEPRRGPRAVVTTARRVLRRLLRPMFARLAEILADLVSRLDRAETSIHAGATRLESAEWNDAVLHKRTDGLTSHLAALNDEFLTLRAEVQRFQAGQPRAEEAEVRFVTGETRLDSAEWNLAVLHKRTDGLAAHLSGLNEEFLALHAEVRRLPDHSTRIDAAESRLQTAEWNVAVLHQKVEGLAAHLAGLSDDHRSLYTEMQARIVQLSALSDAISNHGRRGDEIEEKMRAVHALHWDHVALARRLAVIEDLLAVPPAFEGGETRPLLPFPGLEDVDRVRVG